jgi:regulator of protease activity HflC (stomatin/prohibitin superfamily)
MSARKSRRRIAASATRDGRWWYINLPELGTSGQARTLKEIDEAAAEIAALWLDVEPSDLEVVVTVELPAEVRDAWAEGEREEAEARQLARRAAEQRSQAVHTLHSMGVSYTDAGALLGISKQRAQQLGDRAPRA